MRTRRALLRGVAVAGGVGVAGCGSRGDTGPTYRLQTNPVGDGPAAVARGYTVSDLTTVTPNHPFDYPASYKRRVVRELFETGSVTVPELQFTAPAEFGTTTRPFPRFTTRDGVYRVYPDGRRETTTRQWAFYLDYTEAAPADDAVVVSEPPASLSERDRAIVRAAADATRADRSPPLDADDLSFPSRGVTYHRGLDADESGLIPDPPFDYLTARDNLFAARAERGSVTRNQYSFTVERIADGTAALADYVRRPLVDAAFDSENVADGVGSVLDAATATDQGRLYTESGAPSTGLRTVMRRLGMWERLPATPDGNADSLAGTSFDWSLCRYDDRWYEVALTIR